MHAFSSNLSRTSAYSIIALASVIIAVCINIALQKVHAPNNWLISAPTLAAVYIALYQFVDKVAWRWNILRMTAVIKDTAIDGTYEGKIVAEYNGKSYPVRLIVSQSWTKLLIQFDVLGQNPSSSCSISAYCEDLCNGDVKLNYTYRNTPNPGIAEQDMTMHEGNAEILIKGNGTARGTYFNSRPRKGSIVLKKI